MTPPGDDLLAALRAVRPDPGYQPSATSPEATALLARILQIPRKPTPHLIHRRLLLAGLPAMAGAAAAAILAVSLTSSGVTSSGPDRSGPAASSVRSAVLDAFRRDGGDIVYTTQTIQQAQGPAFTQHSWTYPAFPVPGQRVRFRLFEFQRGVPVEDTESIYVQDAAASHLTMKTTQGPRSAEITDVEYATRTWSRQRSHSVLLAGSLSPSLIRDQIASGHFTVAGTVRLQGHQAIKLTWTWSHAPLTVTTTLWVNARTYQPLRSVQATQSRPHRTLVETDTTTYQMLPATPDNLDLLTPPIPAGFTRTARSPHF